MSVRAYILIEAAPGAGKYIVDGLHQIPAVKHADRVNGSYDVIAMVEGEDLNEVGTIVADKIQALDGIVRSMTLPALWE